MSAIVLQPGACRGAVAWLVPLALAACGVAADPDAPTGTLHRMNRAEYDNTVRDLLSTSRSPAAAFPVDELGYGFDNIADVLTLSPLHVELYEGAAEQLALEAIPPPDPPAHVEAEEGMRRGGSYGDGDASWRMKAAADRIMLTYTASRQSTYRLDVHASGVGASGDFAQVTISVDGNPVTTLDITQHYGAFARFHADLTLAAGEHAIDLSLANPSPAGAPNPVYVDVDWTEIADAFGGDHPVRNRIMVCAPSDAHDVLACARRIAAAFARRAFRRPVAEDEVADLAALAQVALDQGDDFTTGVRLMVQAVLLSPEFLFRVEHDPRPDAEVPSPLDPHELAARLSYFLWSSMPDDALFAAAEAGRLSEAAELDAQVARMLADRRADALIENFASEWLELRELDAHDVDGQAHPEWDDGLRAAMKTEGKLYFRDFLRGDLGTDRLLDAGYSYVNARLARHYGLPASSAVGDGFTRIDLPPSRVGLLTQGAFLTVSSHAARTSPVLRGKWVLDQILCSSPPPPPPGVVGALPETLDPASLRAQLAAHRATPGCASCHSVMDPIGFGFEHYDAIGLFRETNQGARIDASGVLPDGQGFMDARGLIELLRDDPRLPVCIVEQLSTYALGVYRSGLDDAGFAALTGQFASSGYRLPNLIGSIVRGESFKRHRRPSEIGSSP